MYPFPFDPNWVIEQAFRLISMCPRRTLLDAVEDVIQAHQRIMKENSLDKSPASSRDALNELKVASDSEAFSSKD